MRRSLGLAVAALLAAAIVAASASASGPAAHAAGSCNIGQGTGYGYSYLTSLWVSNTSCANGSFVAKHHGWVTGWHCWKTVIDHSPVQYDARVKCWTATRIVKWTFTQNT